MKILPPEGGSYKNTEMRIVPLASGGLLVQTPTRVATGSSFDRAFTADTMRVDYFHTGGPKAGLKYLIDLETRGGGREAPSASTRGSPSPSGRDRAQRRKCDASADA